MTPRTSDNGDHVFGSGLLPVRGCPPAVRHCRALLFPERKMRQKGDDVRGPADGRAGNERVSGGHVSGGKLHVGDNCFGSVYNIHCSTLLRNCRKFKHVSIVIKLHILFLVNQAIMSSQESPQRCMYTVRSTIWWPSPGY